MNPTLISGAELREHRQQFGLSQAKFSELTGVPQHLLSAYELGKSELPSNMALLVTSALSRTPDVHALDGRAMRRGRRGRLQLKAMRAIDQRWLISLQLMSATSHPA